jgi:soluble lytic murein transglycosylase
MVSGNSSAKNTIPVSEKLWQKLSESDAQTLKKINAEIDNKNYDQALIYAFDLKKNTDLPKVENQTQVIKKTPDFYEAVTSIILWKKYSGKINPKSVSFSDISRFASENEFYANINDIKKNVEKVAVANDIPYQKSEKYFNTNPAKTTESRIYLLESKLEFLMRSKVSEDEKDKVRKEARDLISSIWIEENFSSDEEREFFQKYKNQLTEYDHINRIDRLLWEGKIPEGKRLMHLVNEDYNLLFDAIIEIQNSPKYIDKIILSVPRKLRSNEGLAYRKVLWYKSKDRLDDLLDVMLDLPEETSYPEKWWGLRRLYSREMIKKKKYKLAYQLIENHNLPVSASDFWEAEWMSGWISLRFNDEPKIALKHFDKLHKNVVQPVTLSRSSYWIAMAHEAMGNKDKAIEWYKAATKYPIFFYGQLAIHKHRILDPIGAQEDIILPKDPEILNRDITAIGNSVAARVAYLFWQDGDKTAAGKIFEYIVNNATSEGQVAVIMKLINEIGDRQLDAKISRIAAKKNVFFIKDKFQIVKEISNDEYAPLIHAIVKQESGFAPSAVSHVGAIGFMQLMPDTARLVAKEVGVPYNKEKLATDIKYNVLLGSNYIKKLIRRFDGSEMLAIASYNAGPNAAQRWINEFYDPREEKDIDKVVDWIELITYSETRNYVQRIMENLIVYKYLMSRNDYDAVQ